MHRRPTVAFRPGLPKESAWVTIKGKIQDRFDSEKLERAVRDVITKQGLHEDALSKTRQMMYEKCKMD